MEWNSECAQLQLTSVTGAAQSRLNYLVAFISLKQLYEKFGVAHRHASISRHGTIAGSSSDALLL